MYKHRPQKQHTNVGDFIREPNLVWRLPKGYLANSADPDQTLVLQKVKLLFYRNISSAQPDIPNIEIGLFLYRVRGESIQFKMG